MQTIPEKIQASSRKRWRTVAAIAGVVGVGGLVSFAVISQPAPPNIQKLNIASVPLYAATQGDKPTLALALSVEFPTVGAQYVDQPGSTLDGSYSPDKEYLGYYNAEMCYTYQDSPAETPAAGKNKADYKRFAISGAAAGRRCADAFSGNFLNWASSSAVDMLRLALAGGDRVVDEAQLTILQRAILPDGALASDNGPGCFWNSSNFPAKELQRGNGDYFGAVPQAMRAVANDGGRNSIWVANKLNQIYFRTANSRSGNCSTGPAQYSLGTTVYQNGMGSISTQPERNFSTSGRTSCAGENGNCNTNGKIMQVWYGAASTGSFTGGWKTAPVVGSFSCNNTTFGDPAVGIAKACYLTEYNGTWKTAVRTPGLNSDGFFYSRVEVCNQNGSGGLVDERDYRFCQRYPNGNYKPIGTIQHYNAQLRLAAFGYAIDNTYSYNASQTPTDGRYGGVLRAPMKFVGPDVYDESGQKIGANPRAEWDTQTGVFFQNPEGDATHGNSGVINYLNKFGRLLPSKLGNYKRYDPAAELYYEALRYMQGLSPSSAAIANLTPAMHDDFPIYTNWSSLDPFSNRPNTADYSCLKANIALIGDVNTHESKSYGKSRMPTVDVANNIPNIAHWLRVVQAFESKQSMSYQDGSGNMQTTSNPNAASYSGYPYATDRNRSSEMIGLAYWAHTHDIRGASWTANPAKQRPGLRINTFMFDVNEFAQETPDNKRRTSNQYYTAAKYGGFSTQPNAKNQSQPYNTTGNPFYDQNGDVAPNVWQDPDRELEPQAYFLQSDARGVLAAFEKIFSDASSKMDNIADTAASSSSVVSSDLYQYQASFDTGNWSGDLKAFPIKMVDGKPQADKIAAWSAEQKLSSVLNVSAASRKIFVGSQRTKDAANPSTPATTFTASGIESSLKNMLNRPSQGAAEDGLWEDRVGFLRGEKSKEGSLFRTRERALGDIMNSGAQYEGSPSAAKALGDGYDLHVSARKDRVAAVYVGANDGMLHAFNAKTGDELFAYIPSWMGPKLSALTDKHYTQYTHQSYVDATPVVGDAKTGNGTTKDDWKTVLVSGTGGGGKGVFALDVSNPANFNANNVMWEFTHVNDADMGYVVGKPRIVKMQVKHKTSSDSSSKDVYRWFALVPAGANNYVDTGDGVFSQTGNASIFLLALDKKANEAWEKGKNYYKISLPFDPVLGVSRATGVVSLESFSANDQNSIDLVYAGDLHGNMWAFKFTGVDAEDWTAAKLSRYTKDSNAIPMFAAKDTNGNVQPITAAPSVLRVGISDNYMVGFGSGKYIEETDRGSKDPNAYYVLYDNGEKDNTGQNSVTWPVAIDGRGRLRKLTSSSTDLVPEDTTSFRFGRPNADNDTARRAGWYYDFESVGERVIADGQAIDYTSSVLFNSIIPRASSAATGVCGLEGGESNRYTFDYFSVKGTKSITTTVMTGKPLVLTQTTDVGKADSTGRRMRRVDPYTVTPGGAGVTPLEGFYIPIGRLSWRQVNNYHELRSQQ